MTPKSGSLSDGQDVTDEWNRFLQEEGEMPMAAEDTPEFEKKQTDVTDLWELYVRHERDRELNEIIRAENLNPEKTRSLMATSQANGYIETNGLAITNILPPMPLFGAGNKREEKKRSIIEKLEAWLRKYVGC